MWALGVGGRWQGGTHSYSEESARKRKAGLVENHRCWGKAAFQECYSRAKMNTNDNTYHLPNTSSVLNACI